MEEPREKKNYEVGEVVGIYEVVNPTGFSGVLPVAKIRAGYPNAGKTVILTAPKIPKER